MNHFVKFGAVLVVGLLVACGGDAEPVKTDSSGNGVNTSEASCCLNGAFYDCDGDADLANACFNNFEPGECTRDESNDEQCSSGDDEDDGADDGDDFDDF